MKTGGDDLEPIDDLSDDDLQRPLTTRATPRVSASSVVLVTMLVVAGGVAGFSAGVRARDDGAVSSRREVADAVPTAAAEDGSPFVPAGPWMSHDGAYVNDSLVPAWRRTTGDAVALRVFAPRQPAVTNDDMCGGDWCPPVECRGGDGIVVELSTDAIVGVGTSYRDPAIVERSVYASGFGVVGVAEGAPVAYVIARATAPDVHSFELRTGTVTDTSTLHDGWAALAVPIERGTMVAPVEAFTLTARGAGGAPITDVALDGGPPGLPAVCERPAPALPEPGEQPLEVEAAKQGVRDAYATAWSSNSDRATKLDAIDDPANLEALFARVAASFPTAVETTRVDVGDIVFVSPTRAAVHFRLTYDGAASAGNRLGHATFVDGRWKVSRSTVCDILGFAGNPCPTR